MTVADRPPSIETWETEARYLNPDLDLSYVDAAAREAASILDTGVVAEVAYQPGDGTFYGLVIVPVAAMVTVQGRLAEGEVKRWGDEAVRGVTRDRRAFLVCHVGGVSYPLRIGNRTQDLAASYVGEHWKLPAESAVSVALFLRSISWHIDRLRVPDWTPR